MDVIFKRTSIRKYTDQKVEPEKIEKLLRAAFAAPSAGNQQPWEYYVVTDPAKITALAGTSPYAGCVQNAPLALVPCYRTRGLRCPEYAQIDLSASTENVLLEAEELGLGAVWLGIAPLQDRMDAVKKVLDIREDLEAFAIISCGYPAEQKEQQDRYDDSRIHYV